MPPSSQPSSKRVRTHDDDAQRPLDPSEELSQVAGLVERRRLQNKISQRNYRNRIRERLEALEALVDNTNKGQNDNTSKPPGHARTTKSGGVKRRFDEGPRQVPQDQSTVNPSESSSTWNMGDFLDASTAQFDSMYDFAAPHSPVSPQAFTEHVSTRECSPINQASSAMASMNVNPGQAAAAGLEKLDGSTENPRPLGDVPAHISTGSMSPPPPNGQSGPFSPINYGYPITPMSMPIQPLTPGSLPPHVDRREASSDPVIQPGSYPFPMVSPIQSAGYLQPQQFVWVPVPVMTLPPPPAQLSTTIGRSPSTVRPEALGGDDTIGRR